MKIHYCRITKRAINTVFFLTITFCALVFSAEQAEWSGKVIGVKDGDTIEVLHGNQAVVIRFSGIDCPEKGQPFGKVAKHLKSDLCFGKIVTIRPSAVDKYGRTLAEVFLVDGRNIQEELLRLGFAWHFIKYSSDSHLAMLEVEARQTKRGLWADPSPTPPWEWRHSKSNSTNKSIPAGSSKIQTASNFHGNISSYIFHSKACRYYNCGNCTTVFKSREEAIHAGFRPCKLCNP